MREVQDIQTGFVNCIKILYFTGHVGHATGTQDQEPGGRENPEWIFYANSTKWIFCKKPSRVSGKYCEIKWNTVKHRKTEKQRSEKAAEWVGVCRFVCIVKVKYDYSSETANIHLLRCSKFFKLNVRLKYGGNTVEIQLKYGFLQKMYCLVRNMLMHCATI